MGKGKMCWRSGPTQAGSGAIMVMNHAGTAGAWSLWSVTNELASPPARGFSAFPYSPGRQETETGEGGARGMEARAPTTPGMGSDPGRPLCPRTHTRKTPKVWVLQNPPPETASLCLLTSSGCPAHLHICGVLFFLINFLKSTKLSVINTPVPSIQRGQLFTFLSYFLTSAFFYIKRRQHMSQYESLLCALQCLPHRADPAKAALWLPFPSRGPGPLGLLRLE